MHELQSKEDTALAPDLARIVVTFPRGLQLPRSSRTLDGRYLVAEQVGPLSLDRYASQSLPPIDIVDTAHTRNALQHVSKDEVLQARRGKRRRCGHRSSVPTVISPASDKIPPASADIRRLPVRIECPHLVHRIAEANALSLRVSLPRRVPFPR